MSEINHGEGDEVTTQEVDVFTFETNEQRSKFINPGKRTLSDKTVPVNVRVKEAFTTPLWLLATPLILGDVRNNAMIEADLTGSFAVESAVSIKPCSLEAQA